MIVTDFGHDPDDVIAIAYLIEHGYDIQCIVLSPGFQDQVHALYGFLDSYGIDTTICRCSNKTGNYDPGKHKLLMKECPYAHKTTLVDDPKLIYFSQEKTLIIGPAKNLGFKIKGKELFFQGGYSPNSISPLEKFKDVEAVQSFNPSGAKTDFNALRDSLAIDTKRYVGKNVCHGYTKADLEKEWVPSNRLVKRFWDLLKPTKAMHDVLAAKMFLDHSQGVWEQAKPEWVGRKLTTTPTCDEIYTLVGVLDV